jgi:hypothetical protein
VRQARLIWVLPLLAHSGCVGNRYAVSDELASARHDRKWLVRREPPPEPVAPAAVTTQPAASESATPADAALPAAAPPSAAAFPEAETDSSTPSADASPAVADAGEAVAPPIPEQVPIAEPPLAHEEASVPTTHERIDLSQEPDPSAGEPEKPKLRRMVWGLSMRLGGTFASEDLIVAEYTDGSTETLTTGGGVNFFFGTTVTPFKVGSHTLGFGLEAGWKFSTIGAGSDTDITFSRNAFMPRVQYGYELTPAILWISAIGAQYETDVELKARGGLVGDTQFDNALGYFGETGFLLDVGLFGLDLTLRHTRLRYSLPEGPSIDGNSFGIFGTVHIGLLKTENTAASPASSK